MNHDLFSEAHARRSDPETSKAAAKGVNASRYELVVLNALEYGPATIREIETRTGVHYGTISPRFAPLVKRGLIEVVGRKDRRQVYQLVGHG